MSDIAKVAPSAIEIDGIVYVPKKSVPDGSRAIVVVDRGWIFAGDLTEFEGRVKLSNAVWVFNWKSVGFAAVVNDPTNADIRKIADVDIPAASEIYRIQVPNDWGLNQ